MPEGAPPLLEVTDLRVRLGALDILRGVSLSVPAQGVVSVLGANGVGKTTLLRTLSGIYAPSAGTIRLDGAEIGGLPSHEIVARGLAQAPGGMGGVEPVPASVRVRLA